MLWQTLGFENIKRYFERAVSEDSLEHAYLFSGQDMIGKRTFAIELVNHLRGAGGTVFESLRVKNYVPRKPPRDFSV